MQTEDLEGQESIFDRDSACGKMSSVALSSGRDAETGQKKPGADFKKSSKRSSKLKNHTFMLLDLRPGAGICWGHIGSTILHGLDRLGCSTLRSAPKTSSSVPCGRFCSYSAIPILAIPDSVPGYSAPRSLPRQIAATLIGSSFAYAGRA